MDNQIPAALDGVLAEIRAELTGLHAQNKFLNEVVDRLYTDNERLRRAESRSTPQPAVRELMKLADDWRGRTAVVGVDTDPAALCDELVEDVTMILERQGIEELAVTPGSEFDRHLHRAVGTQPTRDEALDGHVAQIRRPGYRDEERIVRFAQVVVFKFAAAAD